MTLRVCFQSLRVEVLTPSAGHLVDESVLSVAISRSSHFMVTADSSGIVKTWSLSALLNFWTVRGCVHSPPPDCIKPLAAWRGHQGGISSIAPMAAEETLFVTSGFDHRVVLWSVHGAHVGTFGEHAWQLDSRGAWVAEAPPPLAKLDFQRMQQSAQPEYMSEPITPAESHASLAYDARTAPLETTPREVAHAQARGQPQASLSAAADGADALTRAAEERSSAWESVQALLGECVTVRHPEDMHAYSPAVCCAPVCHAFSLSICTFHLNAEDGMCVAADAQSSACVFVRRPRPLVPMQRERACGAYKRPTSREQRLWPRR